MKGDNRPRRDGFIMRIGAALTGQLDRLEELDRIAPGTVLETGFTIDGVRFDVTAKVAARGVRL